MVDLVRELAETSRRAILAELYEGPRTVSELVASTGLKQPNVSNHLARLKTCGLLRAVKDGRNVYYSFADPESAAAVSRLLLQHTDGNSKQAVGPELAKVLAKLACDGREEECLTLISRHVRQGVPLADVYQGLLAPALHFIGDWWTAQAIDIGQEHLACEIVERIMGRVSQFCLPSKPTGPTAVIGSIEGNWHSLGGRMLSDVLAGRGWKVYFLGQNVPVTAFHEAIVERNPQAALISIHAEDQVHLAEKLVTALRSSSGMSSLQIGVGGWISPAGLDRLKTSGATFTSSGLRTFNQDIAPALERGDVQALNASWGVPALES